MVGLDVVGEVVGNLMEKEIRQGEFERLAFGGKNILLDDSDNFSEGGEVDNKMRMLIEMIQEVYKVIMDSFTLSSDKPFQLDINVRAGNEESINCKWQRIDRLVLFLFHGVIVDRWYINEIWDIWLVEKLFKWYKWVYGCMVFGFRV